MACIMLRDNSYAIVVSKFASGLLPDPSQTSQSSLTNGDVICNISKSGANGCQCPMRLYYDGLDFIQFAHTLKHLPR